MDRETAQSLTPLVTDKKALQMLEVYISHRIDVLRGQLENLTDHHAIIAVQGQIRELRRLRTLRDEVESNRK